MIQLRKVYSPLPLGTTAIIFKLLFPEEDHARKYDMQETRLSQHLAECFSVNSQNFQSWCSENSSGCLGAEVKVVLDKICPVGLVLTRPTVAKSDTIFVRHEMVG